MILGHLNCTFGCLICILGYREQTLSSVVKDVHRMILWHLWVPYLYFVDHEEMLSGVVKDINIESAMISLEISAASLDNLVWSLKTYSN